MRIRWKRSAGLLAAAGLVSALGAGTASAQGHTATSGQYDLYASTVGVPAWVRAGTTFSAHTWYMQNSPVRITVADFDADLWSRVAADHRGVTVTWLNPVTHRWQASTSNDAQGSGLALGMLPSQEVTMMPNHWYRLDFKVTIAGTVRAGLWHIGAGISSTGYRGFAPPPVLDYQSNEPTAHVYH